MATPCPGVEGAESAIVAMVLEGPGLWDWISANMALFQSSMTTDIASTLHIHEDYIADVTARLGTTPAGLLLLSGEDQTVDTTFTVLSGASTTLTPMALSQAFSRAVSNGTANFSSTEGASGIKMAAKVTGVKQTTVMGQGTGGLLALTAMLLCFCGICVMVVRMVTAHKRNEAAGTEASKDKSKDEGSKHMLDVGTIDGPESEDCDADIEEGVEVDEVLEGGEGGGGYVTNVFQAKLQQRRLSTPRTLPAMTQNQLIVESDESENEMENTQVQSFTAEEGSHASAFSEWLSAAQLAEFEQKLLSDAVGVTAGNWREDVKELDVETCRSIGMSIVQSKKLIRLAHGDVQWDAVRNGL